MARKTERWKKIEWDQDSKSDTDFKWKWKRNKHIKKERYAEQM